jgi:hypothetical protein
VYYKCVKFHKNPISRLGGDTLTRYMDGRTDGWTDRRMDGRTDGWMDGRMDGRTDGWTDGRMDGGTDRQGDSYIPPSFVCGGYTNIWCLRISNRKQCVKVCTAWSNWKTLRHIRIEIIHGSQNVFWVLTWVPLALDKILIFANRC